MPWEKAFDVDEALGQALDLFWSNGFEATSINDLLRQMGINRGSFYDTFSGKRELFLAALKRYETEVVGPVVARAAAEQNPLQGILSVFETAVADAVSCSGTRGCFFTNTALELAAKDQEIAGMVRSAFSQIEEFFRHRLLEAKSLGLAKSEMNEATTAAALVALLLGLRVLARAQVERRVLEAVFDQARAIITA